MQLLTLAVVALLVVADYALNTWLLSDAEHVGDWGYNLTVKLLGAIMIAASLVANFWIIYKKNDAWVGWIVYCVSGLAMFTKLGNVFSMLLFLVMLAINTSAFMAWLKQSKN
jgi:nicotinamide riboside transporter PnuC